MPQIYDEGRAPRFNFTECVYLSEKNGAKISKRETVDQQCMRKGAKKGAKECMRGPKSTKGVLQVYSENGTHGILRR